eukprot:g7985.t1
MNILRLIFCCFVLVSFASKVHAGWFYGIAYTPFRVFGLCPTDDEVESDISVLLKHTNRVRIYSTECQNVNKILLKHSSEGRLSILFGVWVDNRKTDQQEVDFLIEALKEFPNANVEGIAVGNEVLFRNSMPKAQLLGRVTEVRNKVRGLGNYNGNPTLKSAPVFAVEMFPDPDVAQYSDVLGLNIHPFYRPDLVDVADPELMSDRILEASKQQIKLYWSMAPHKQLVVTEIGWPTQSSPRDLHRGDPVVALRFMEKFSAYCVQSGIKYYWFELFDSNWKKPMYWGAQDTMSEFNFGIYHVDRKTIKKIPGHNRKLMQQNS